MEKSNGNVVKIASKPNRHRGELWFPVRWSDDSETLYVKGPERALWRYSLADDTLVLITRLTEDINVLEFDVTSNGERIVYRKREGQSDIWLVENYGANPN